MHKQQQELAELLRAGNSEDAARMLQKNEPLSFYKDDSGRTAIHWAACGGCLDVVQLCVSRKEDSAGATDDMGWTPLMISSSAGRAEVVAFLLSLPQVLVNAANTNGQTALHYAASRNHVQIVSLLLKNGANVNAQDKYMATPLHRAASQGHMKVVGLLLDVSGIQVNIRDSSGCSPLHLAIEEEQEDIAICLVKHGGNLYQENKEKQTPLSLVKSSELKRKLCSAAQ
uniref:ANK_REP_REGION domain-containing protein n=1 Tax=Syphacia muris TaxID=451379 RepID=A0A0N5AJ51_9BILA